MQNIWQTANNKLKYTTFLWVDFSFNIPERRTGFTLSLPSNGNYETYLHTLWNLIYHWTKYDTQDQIDCSGYEINKHHYPQYTPFKCLPLFLLSMHFHNSNQQNKGKEYQVEICWKYRSDIDHFAFFICNYSSISTMRWFDSDSLIQFISIHVSWTIILSKLD